MRMGTGVELSDMLEGRTIVRHKRDSEKICPTTAKCKPAYDLSPRQSAR